ncbi:hypothetical protein E4412_03660 [Leptospira interrogans]|nr:hypothetical protein E4412_03660 [Leptospira interrogans]
MSFPTRPIGKRCVEFSNAIHRKRCVEFSNAIHRKRCVEFSNAIHRKRCAEFPTRFIESVVLSFQRDS